MAMTGVEKNAILKANNLKEPKWLTEFLTISRIASIEINGETLIGIEANLSGSSENRNIVISKEQYDAFEFSRITGLGFSGMVKAMTCFVDNNFGYVDKDGTAKPYRRRGWTIQSISAIANEDSKEAVISMTQNSKISAADAKYRALYRKDYDPETATESQMDRYASFLV